jgi:S-adenosylmethionine:tRNA ribosyltransferase-isomerase
MKLAQLQFERPESLQADAPPELRGLARDGVRLLVSTPDGWHQHATFEALPAFLVPGDLLVVNESATLPASLPARRAKGAFRLNLSTDYGLDLWLAEPRFDAATPGPIEIEAGEALTVAGLNAQVIMPYPGLPRLWFIQFEGDVRGAMASQGQPIQYAYLAERLDLNWFQTLFAHQPGSAEMPSAARPFTPELVAALERRGVEIARLALHSGVSSLEVATQRVEAHSITPEPFEVPPATAHAVQRTRQQGGRIIAVGTTVVRALESAFDGERVRPSRGFTRLFLHPGRKPRLVDGLLTGFHDPVTSHLALLYALAGEDGVRSAYQEAVEHGYLWHEFGDSHLLWRRASPIE